MTYLVATSAAFLRTSLPERLNLIWNDDVAVGKIGLTAKLGLIEDWASKNGRKVPWWYVLFSKAYSCGIYVCMVCSCCHTINASALKETDTHEWPATRLGVALAASCATVAFTVLLAQASAVFFSRYLYTFWTVFDALASTLAETSLLALAGLLKWVASRFIFVLRMIMHFYFAVVIAVIFTFMPYALAAALPPLFLDSETINDLTHSVSSRLAPLWRLLHEEEL